MIQDGSETWQEHCMHILIQIGKDGISAERYACLGG